VTLSASLRTLLFLYVAASGLLLVACADRGGDSAASDAISDSVAASAPSASATAEASSSSGEPSAPNASGAVSSQIASMAMLRTQELDSLRFVMRIGISDLPGYAGEVELSIEGAVDQSTGSFEMAIDFGAFMEAMAAAEGQSAAEAALVASLFGDGVIEMRQVGDTAYMRWPALGALFGAETDWISFPADEAAESSFDASGILASEELLDELASVGMVTNLGREDVHGTPTTHYEALIDYSKAYGSMSSGAPVPLTAPDAAAIAGLTIPFGLWIDDDGLVRRMTMEFESAELGLSAAELAESPGAISLRFDIVEVGGAVVILAPPASDVTDMTEIDGGSLFGDLF